MTIYDTIVACLMEGKPIDNALIEAGTHDVDEYQHALRQCDFYGVDVNNRPSDAIGRKEVVFVAM